ncbi:tRNA (guanosine(46)-N7)-methyltransferase TrmB [Bacillus horti]|uniref:tRNA (guanine-N(7)-)-methyltransferase n=1 Tax=Caldalkalibacillus horti TaxID=77523 RepID=A0ABT9VWT8_9BACI|nr:tRNA (guanosine(46)-N7)-methyltransferase TrmB [Bacillus horti]MDQ0165447.1 tRNA (guanine-N7-)-methyltransferase [Bacillus horti]
MRLRKKPWADAEIEASPHIVVPNPTELKGKWHQFFKNNNPIHIELGTGKGQFITGMAQAHPHINYIGMELQTSVIAMALKKAKEVKAPNLCLLNQNALQLPDFFEPEELERIYVNFSDPWPKTRHAKRRLTHQVFLDIYLELLGEGNEIHMKTDNEGLFEFSLNSFSDFGCRLKNITLNLHESDMEGNIMTEYEEKFSSQGMKIYRCEAVLPAQK